MSIRLEIDGDSVVEFDDETITLGSDPGCTVPFPSRAGLALKHAVIRRIAGRWIVEVREADSIQVGDAAPTRMHWLNRGDVIRLTGAGPVVKFEPDRAPTRTALPRCSAAPRSDVVARPTLRSTATPAESDTLQLSKPKSVVVPPFEDAVEVNELKVAREAAKPSATRPPTGRLTPSRSEGEDEFENAPYARPLPPLVKSTSWLDDSTSAASRARRKRAGRRFWMQMAGVGVLALVAIAIWQFGGGGSDANPRAESNPRSGTDSEPAQNQQASANSTGNPARPDPVKDSNPTTPVKPVETVAVSKSNDPQKTATDPAAVGLTPVTPKPGKGPSATLVAVRDGVYAVFAQHANEEHCFRIGTAWAASRRNLVTSGAVANAVEELQREGLTIVVSQPFQERPISIKGVRMHAAYRQAIERAAIAREQIAAAFTPPVKGHDDSFVPPEEELARAMATQSRFDLGVLDIAMGERLPNPLKMDSNELPDAATNEFLLVGFPFAGDEYRAKTVFITEDAKERQSPKSAGAKSESNLTLTMAFPEDVSDNNWSGSPVFNRNRRVIGVYSRASKPVETSAKKPPLPRHAVIWLGRLREFAPEVDE